MATPAWLGPHPDRGSTTLAGDAHAQNPDTASLSDEQLALFWFFFDSRNRRGTPTVTRTHAAKELRWSERKVRTVMDEIQDAGYWVLKDNGIPVIDPAHTPETRPVPAWLEWASESESGVATHTHATHAGATHGTKPLTTNYSQPHSTKRNPFGVSPTAGRLYIQVTKSEVLNLTDYFEYKVRKAYGGFAPDPINREAIRFHIRRWIKEGIPVDSIREMINLFVTDTGSRPSGGAPVWKSFLAQRQRLLTMVENQTTKQKRISHWEQRRLEEGV